MVNSIETFKHGNDIYEIRVSGDDNDEGGQLVQVFLNGKPTNSKFHLPQFAESDIRRMCWIDIKKDLIDSLKNGICKEDGILIPPLVLSETEYKKNRYADTLFVRELGLDIELKDVIKSIQIDLKKGRFANDEAIKQDAIIPILNSLGWPVFDPEVIWPQYSIGGERVDYALCHPKRKPVIFIEAKQVERDEGADRQLFEHVSHSGVPMVIFTDGQKWRFYLPAERGHYEERCVYKLDILERCIEESVELLTRYLSFQRVCSGESLDCASKNYKDVVCIREINDTLPQAWRRLIEDHDDLLIELIADKVADMCGYKPDTDSVSKFLEEQEEKLLGE